MDHQNEMLATIRSDVEARGWVIRPAVDPDSGFTYAYTVGLSRFALPEIITYGLTLGTSHDILNKVAERAVVAVTAVSATHPLVPGTVIADMLHGAFPAAVIQVDDPEAKLPMAHLLFGEESLHAVQLVFPDTQWRWPWDVESDVYDQLPVLGEPPRHLR